MLFLGFAGLYGQQSIKASGITFSYEINGDALKCALTAPTQGWIGVGFNHNNSIVGSDLLLFHVVDGKPSSRDLYVKEVGNPINDKANGGSNTITLIDGMEDDSSTKVVFSIPLNSRDPNDFVHIIENEFWLILAYSVDDDFRHHSRVRKHLPLVLKKGP